MKRIPRDPERFEVIDLVNAIGRKTSFKIGDRAGEAKILGRLNDSYQRAKANAAMLHGRRTEDMFAYVAASLGRCVLVKEEDAGEVYAISSTLRIPDYRLVTNDEQEFLVEVKNVRQSSPRKPLKLKATYVDGLLEYAALCKKDLKLAVYWSRWNLWTLVSGDRLAAVGGNRQLTLLDAMQASDRARARSCNGRRGHSRGGEEVGHGETGSPTSRANSARTRSTSGLSLGSGSERRAR